MRRAFDLMVSRAEALAQLTVLENGKAQRDARAEVRYAAEFFRWYSEEAVRLSGEIGESPSGANRIVVLRKPIGVTLLITPWDFPAAMATRKIGPALAAGCSVVLKPASETPLTALAIAALMSDAGVPAGVVNVVPTRRSDALASRLLDDERVRKVSFTESTEVGRTLLAHAARTVVSSAMELGGKSSRDRSPPCRERPPASPRRHSQDRAPPVRPEPTAVPRAVAKQHWPANPDPPASAETTDTAPMPHRSPSSTPESDVAR
ncbi:aldehyde dehydrogenase family protein [Mycobacterium sp. AZCC_0083]|uniref:aldehyde dehydrogenase family protein n=1 Tax=Mycobacterium sp. AZCC_0083 TaxID=2735882 RepID=UPI0021085A54|nr:aldehyde dehydrogenase family protein [Mycobacterium sp. AZCC_0083]